MIEHVFDIVFDPEAPARLVGVLADSVAAESRLMSARLSAVADLLEQRTAELDVEDVGPDYVIITGFARASTEVGAALNVSAGVASRVVGEAEALRYRLPRLGALLAAGEIDWRSVQLVIRRTEFVSESVIGEVDEQLAEQIGGWQCWSDRRITTTVDTLVKTLDPAAIRERERAEDRRRVQVSPRGDGTAKIDAVVSTSAGLAFEARVAELAAAVCVHDPRSRQQRRAEAVEAMAEGLVLVCGCGRPECPAREAEPPVRPGRWVFNMIVGADTVLGGGMRPGYVSGYGVVDADYVRTVAEQATVRWVQAPSVEAAAALRYQPSAAVQRWVRCRDLTCRFPGCDCPAERCDLDHTVPFCHADPANGGRTVPTNLKCLCRFHHRLKTFGGWHDEQYADGTVVWTSPSGARYRTTPGGADLFDTFTTPAPCAEPSRPRRRMRTRAGRVAAVRAKNRRLGPVNETNRYIDKARRRELERRRNRNRMRATLQLFKGTEPSASPYCAWINDPFEPEELPPDWRPPPPPPPGPEDPPF